MVHESSSDKMASLPEPSNAQSSSLFQRVMEEPKINAGAHCMSPDLPLLSSQVDNSMTTLTKSLPAKDGESYSQVLERMFPKMKENDLQALTHDVIELNGNKELNKGDSFEILSDYGKKLLKYSILKEHEHDEIKHSDSKMRTKFSPAYVEAMQFFKTQFKAQSKSQLLPDIDLNFD